MEPKISQLKLLTRSHWIVNYPFSGQKLLSTFGPVITQLSFVHLFIRSLTSFSLLITFNCLFFCDVLCIYFVCNV